MADTIPVRAVPGRLFMGNRPGEYVGYRRCEPTDADVAHRFGNDGPAYALTGETVVLLNVPDVRRAIARGDLERVGPDEPKTKPQKPIRAAQEG